MAHVKHGNHATEEEHTVGQLQFHMPHWQGAAGAALLSALVQLTCSTAYWLAPLSYATKLPPASWQLLRAADCGAAVVCKL